MVPPTERGSGRMFVFGADAATFEPAGCHEDPSDQHVGGSAVASSDVVD
jgi:hypothetical protein